MFENEPRAEQRENVSFDSLTGPAAGRHTADREIDKPAPEHQHDFHMREFKHSCFPKSRIRQIVDEYIAPTEQLSDEDMLLVHVTCHSSGITTTHEISAGSWRQQIHENLLLPHKENPYRSVGVSFPDGGGLDLSYHDYYSVQHLSTELKAERERVRGLNADIDALEKLGVDPDIFRGRENYADRGWEGTESETPKFTLEKIVEYGEIIKGYLANKARK